jgi:hypothetical protein
VSTTVAQWLDQLDDAGPRASFDRTALDDAARRAVVGVAAEHLPLRLPKRRVALIHQCPRRAVAEAYHVPTGDATALVIGQATEAAARLHLWGRYPVGDPVGLAEVLRLQAAARREPAPVLSAEQWADVVERADRFARSWGQSDRVGDVHVGERLTVALAPDDDGRAGVVLTGITDISIGTHVAAEPHRRRAVVELKSGDMPPNPLNELSWYQLVVAAADRYAPHGVAIWSASPARMRPDGELAETPVTPGSLAAATAWVIDALDVVGELARGATPAEQPGSWCRWCPERIGCPSAIWTPERGEADWWSDGIDDDGDVDAEP